MRRSSNHLLLVWLIFTGAVVFALVVAFERGLVQLLVYSDRSKLSLLIGLLYLIGTMHCAVRTVQLSRELTRMDTTETTLMAAPHAKVSVDSGSVRVGDHTLPRSWFTAYFVDLARATHLPQPSDDNVAPRSDLLDAFSTRVRGAHDIGWFVVDILIKLGLLGTIIGFILMLGPISQNTTFDINTMQKILQQMSSGMATALFTTLAGLLGSVLLGLQYHFLDRGADELIDKTVRLSEVELLPRVDFGGRTLA